MPGFKTPRRFGRFETTNVETSNLEQNLYQVSLATDIIDSRAFGGLDDVNVGPTAEQMISNAIQYAVAVGAHFVFIPTSMNNYNPALVVTNPNVTLVNEFQNAAGNAGLLSSTYVASAFVGATKEAKIQAAINAAALAGAKAVYVPQSMLPYDASQVTFNNAVHMLREGGRLDLDYWEVMAYGGSNIGANDAYPAAVAAIAGAQASGFGGTIWYSQGTNYSHSRPVRVTGKSIRVAGPGVQAAFNQAQSGATLSYNFYGGPLLVAGDWPIPTRASLVTGPGVALDWSGNGTTTYNFLNLRESATCDLNGLSAFTAEFWMQLTATMPDNMVISSAGKWLTSDAELPSTNGGAFGFRGISPNFGAGIKTTAGTTNLNMTTPVDGLVHHYALSWDGTTVRWFLDGVQQATGARAGTMVQGVAEEIFVGPVTWFAPGDKDGLRTSFKGYIDGIRLSNNARYTSGFTPSSSKFSLDANTLILLNNATIDGPLLKAETKNGDVWLVVHQTGAPTSQATGFEATGFTIHDGSRTRTGIVLGPNTNDPYLHRINIDDCRNGLIAHHDNFFFRCDDFFIQENGSGGARYGVYVGNFGGLGRIRGLRVFGYAVAAMSKGGGLVWDDPYIKFMSTTVYGIVIQGSDIHQTHTFNTPHFDAEGAGSNLIAELALTSEFGDQTLVVNGGGFESHGATQHLVFDQWDSAQFNGSVFATQGGNTDPTQIMKKAAGTLAQAVQFNGTKQRLTAGSFVRLSDTPGTAAIGPLGKGVAITYAATLNLDCSLRDEFEITALTGALTLNLINATPGQTIGISAPAGAGAGAITFGTINGTGAFKGASANDTTNGHYNEYTFRIGLNLNATQQGFSSGA